MDWLLSLGKKLWARAKRVPTKCFLSIKALSYAGDLDIFVIDVSVLAGIGLLQLLLNLVSLHFMSMWQAWGLLEILAPAFLVANYSLLKHLWGTIRAAQTTVHSRAFVTFMRRTEKPGSRQLASNLERKEQTVCRHDWVSFGKSVDVCNKCMAIADLNARGRKIRRPKDSDTHLFRDGKWLEVRDMDQLKVDLPDAAFEADPEDTVVIVDMNKQSDYGYRYEFGWALPGYDFSNMTTSDREDWINDSRRALASALDSFDQPMVYIQPALRQWASAVVPK